MPHGSAQRFEKFPELRKCIDFPRPDQTVYDECISIVGWVHAEARDPAHCHVRAWLDGNLIGGTGILFARPDVSEFLSIAPDLWTGFRFLARSPKSGDGLIQVTVSWDGEDAEFLLGKVSVRLHPAALHTRPHGEVLFPAQSRQLHRENIYGSGPPMLEPGVEMLRIIRDYLAPRSSIIDVGCGAGAYGPALMAAGHHWTGLEVNQHCLELLEQRQLPFRKTNPGGPFPGANGEFDEAICIEVLEHIEQPEFFLGEIARIIRSRALFSVPNIEVIPYFKDWEAVPWHMLEGDHKNFFTRTNLRTLLASHFSRVEVFSYIEHPVRTRAGIPLHGHLFAVADK